MRKVIVGNHAVSLGVKLARAEVIAAYPITPQTQVVEMLSEMCGSGELPARFIKVESEHSAMAAVVGASAAGARTFTATSSQGLALMHEMLHWAAGARHPIVMANINRAMGPGWNIWADQNDSLSQRDTGWIQLYCENNQEVLDTTIQAFRLAEAVDPGFVPDGAERPCCRAQLSAGGDGIGAARAAPAGGGRGGIAHGAAGSLRPHGEGNGGRARRSFPTDRL